MNEALFDYLDEKFMKMNNRFDALESKIDESNYRLKINEAKQDLMNLTLESMEISEMIDESVLTKDSKFVKSLIGDYANNDK